MSLGNYSFSLSSPTLPQPSGQSASARVNLQPQTSAESQGPIKSLVKNFMIDLSQKKEGLKGIDVEQSKSQGRAPSLMSPADLNSMQTTAIDIGISNRTSAVKIGQIELAKQMGKGGLAKKNSRNSSTHRFSMTLNNIQFRKLGTIQQIQNSTKVHPAGLPGPGEYEPRDSLSKDRIRSATIYQQPQRFKDFTRADSPGPGNYYKDEYFARNASPISLKGKAKEAAISATPGPGAYDPTLLAVRDALRSVNLSSSQRPSDFKIREADVPGPGTYDIKKTYDGKITLKGRIPVRTSNDVPGPGTYELPQSISPTVRIVKGDQRFKEPSHKDNTGPGMYDVKQRKIGTDGPKFSLGGKTSQKRQDESPGPGQYDASLSAARSKSPQFKMRGRDYYEGAMKQLEQLPGPGAYDPLHPIGTHAPKISLHGKPQSKMSRDQRPGPGAYEAKLDLVKQRILTPLLSSSQRGLEPKKAQSPGPGEYEHELAILKNPPKITLKPRIENIERSQSPGPGQYEPRETYVKDSVRGFKFHGTPMAIDNMRRIQQLQSALQQPGPGHYDQPTTIGKNSPMISMKSRVARPIKNEVPGPGEYEPLKSLQALRDKSKGAKISGLSKSTVNLESIFKMPGPGQYDPSPIKTSLGFSLHGRIKEPSRDNLPGPGVYEVPTPSVVRFKNPSFDFSKSPERDRLQKASVDLGPGAYDQVNEQVLLSGRTQIVYSFGKPSQRDSNQLRITPGPGAYDLPKTFGVQKREDFKPRSRSKASRGEVVYK